MYHFINDNFHTDIATVPPSYKMKHFHEHKAGNIKDGVTA